MRISTRLTIVGLAALFAGCGDGGSGRDGGGGSRGDGGSGGGSCLRDGGGGGGGNHGDAAELPDGGECECRVVEAFPGSNVNATLWMSLRCFCERFGCEDYQATCQDDPLNRAWERFDYPAEGLTVLRWMNQLSGYERVFDSDGTLVGALNVGDTNSWCPSNPSLGGSNVRAGRFPPAGCEARSCGACTAPAPSCGAR